MILTKFVTKFALVHEAHILVFDLVVGNVPFAEIFERHQGRDVRCCCWGQPNINTLMLHEILLFQ